MNINESTFKDIKLIQFMLFRIKKYQDKKCDIMDLVYGIENYLNQISTIDEDWKTTLRTLWIDLEIAYALSLERENEVIYENEHKVIEDSLNQLKKLLINKLIEFEDTVDFTTNAIW